jgi:pyridinium-3,5-bisthiocarboxylic acid mononucleotide nickel chelatase
MRVEHIGYGAGTRNSKDFPNVVRLSIGEDSDPFHVAGSPATGVVTVLETAVDDMSPQLLAYVAETALASGALDVMLTPVIMKKGRPGTLLTILCDPADSPVLEQLMLRETTTLGIRIRQDRRTCLDRRHTTVSTPYGDSRIKVGSVAGEALNVAPEFEDCRAASSRCGTAIKTVHQAAVAAFLQLNQKIEGES